MNSFKEQIDQFMNEAARLHKRQELSKVVGPDYFEPGKMEYLDKSDFTFKEDSGEMILRFESRGTRYDGRTEIIERISIGDPIQVVRDKENEFNSNNFSLLTNRGKNVGNMPAELCNVIAPLFDSGIFVIENAFVSFVDPISKRSRYAKQAVLFVEMHAHLAD